MMANMASSLILHKRINTTLAKAKALRTYVEPLITKSKLSVTTRTSKEEATHLRRVVFSYLQNKEAVAELFSEISVKVIDREGGYTRIIKTGTRLGDNAEMCMMELVDFNANLLADKGAADAKSKRRRRGAKKKGDEPVAAQVAAVTAVAAEAMEEITETEKTEQTVEDKVADPAEVEEIREVAAEETSAESEASKSDAAGETKPDDDSGNKNKKDS
jgi:large subunit ribosomal protein L17